MLYIVYNIIIKYIKYINTGFINNRAETRGKKFLRKFWLVFFVVMLFTPCLLFKNNKARAEKIINAEDNISRLEASIAADHEIKFKTIAGVSAADETVAVIFASGFDLANISLDEVDLYSGSVTGLENEKNLTNTAGVGRWGFEKNGQKIILTPPTDTMIGEIDALDWVVIRIGKNASGGVGRIINPNIAGIYTVSIGGDFGESGACYIPVLSDDTAEVTARVAELTDETAVGGGGPIIKDISAPIIKNIVIENVTSNSAIIRWESDERAIGTVEYGQDAAYGETITDENNLLAEHQYILFPLEQNKNYYARIKTKDQSGNMTMEEGIFFETISVNNVSSFKAVGEDGKIFLSWTNPKISNMAGVRVLRDEDQYAEESDDGLVVYEGPGEFFLDQDVINDKKYFYTIFVYDTTRQYSSGAIAKSMPQKDGKEIGVLPDEGEGMEEIPAGLKFRDIEFWVANGTLRLETDSNNQVTVLSETLVSVLLSGEKVVKKLKTIIAQIDDSSYLLKVGKNKNKYQAAISAPKEMGNYPIVILVIIYEDGTKDTVRGNLVVKDYGTILGLPRGSVQYVFAGAHSEELSRVDITLFEGDFLEGRENWEVWQGEKYYQNNPQITDEQGEYGYMVANGKYYMVLEKEGYRKSITPVFEVRDNTINWDLHLERVFFKKWYEKIEYWLVIGLLFLIILFWKRKKKKEEFKNRKIKILQESL